MNKYVIHFLQMKQGNEQIHYSNIYHGTHSYLHVYINNSCSNKMLLKSQVMMELNVKRVTWYMSHLISLHSYAFSRQTQVKDTSNTE